MKMKEGSQTKESRCPLEAEKLKEVESSLGTPEGNTCRYLGLRSGGPTLDHLPPELQDAKRNRSGKNVLLHCLRHKAGDNLLWQQGISNRVSRSFCQGK